MSFAADAVVGTFTITGVSLAAGLGIDDGDVRLRLGSTFLTADQYDVTVTPGTSLTLSAPNVIAGDTSTMQITRTNSTTSDLVVNLSSDSIDRATVPDTVIIPAGAADVTFTLTGVA